ncbi:MAG: pantetheine-phosphate adenylyltransferase [Candidatus Stahlbacteria bacterium]|nr:MAG: pantetheine-phosphate adenylyltransferase [Candidatus Stahlbacteria bacterium]
MKKAIYPGTFDPITNGHIDILERSLKIFDEVTLLVAEHYSKDTLFTPEERKELIEIALKDIDNVNIEILTGLTAEYVNTHKIDAVIRGMRAISDFEYEFQMGMMNRKLSPNIEIIYFFPDEKYIFLSSRVLKEIAYFNGDISEFVPEEVAKRLKERIKKLR